MWSIEKILLLVSVPFLFTGFISACARNIPQSLPTPTTPQSLPSRTTPRPPTIITDDYIPDDYDPVDSESLGNGETYGLPHVEDLSDRVSSHFRPIV